MHRETSTQLVDYREAAEFLGLPIGTMYALVSRREIPCFRLGPRLVRFRMGELESWLAARRVRMSPAALGGRRHDDRPIADRAVCSVGGSDTGAEAQAERITATRVRRGT